MSLVIATHNDWDVLQLDAPTAILNTCVKEKVDVKTPPGYGSGDVATRLPHGMKDKNSLYGLRRSPRN